jgi:hypothetical protein
MRTKNAWWMLIVGMVGALLAAGAAVQAEDFPGDGVTGPPLSYRLQSDGTVRDNNTLLIWEVKDTGGGIHDVGNAYTWSSGGSLPDGTAFTDFLATLNNTCAGDETTACTKNVDCTGIGNSKCGYAGHQDWRMPNVKELQSIVDYSTKIPAIASSFPGATAADDYWSSPPLAGYSSSAWVVNFGAGAVEVIAKDFPLRVRAVRGGR